MPESTPLMKRPTRYDELVKQRAVEIMLPKFVEYCEQGNGNAEEEGLIKDLMTISPFDNSFDMARHLVDRHSWAGDRELVDLCDDLDTAYFTAEREMVEQWIQVYDIKPSRAIGDKILYRRPLKALDRIGEIIGFNENEAKYHVKFPDSSPSGYTLVPYENALDVPAKANVTV